MRFHPTKAFWLTLLVMFIIFFIAAVIEDVWRHRVSPVPIGIA